MPASLGVHATCIVLHEAGVLIRGESGAGKTSLALLLLDHAARMGFHGALVGDDRLRLTLRNGRIVARPHPDLAGLVEIRGHGIRRLGCLLDAAVVLLVVDLVAQRPRLPEEAPGDTVIIGVRLPRLVVDEALIGRGLGVRLVLDALSERTACVAVRTHPPILARRWPDDP